MTDVQKVQYACVVLIDGVRTYSHFWDDKDEAIAHAKALPGIIAVEEAHAGKAPVWVRPT